MSGATTEDDDPIVEIRKRGQLTVPKETREELDERVFTISKTDDGGLKLTPYSGNRDQP